ncbi:MAG: cupin domain-containing protein [Kofleriaceae bacterium]
MSRRHAHVVHLDEVEPVDNPHGKFAPRERYLAEAAGGHQLGCSFVELPPGAAAWPFHCHYANEEAIYVLSGTGTARIGDARIAIAAGDYLALPAGQGTAHQTINTGTEPLRYLCCSTMVPTDVIGYPDSGKLGLSASEAAARRFAAPGAPRQLSRATASPTGMERTDDPPASARRAPGRGRRRR